MPSKNRMPCDRFAAPEGRTLALIDRANRAKERFGEHRTEVARHVSEGTVRILPGKAQTNGDLAGAPARTKRMQLE